jgi:nucleotide-binding universal stress UspA family protein
MDTLIKKILVPTDFSKGSEKAYIVAANLAKTFGAKVDFLHVIPTLKYFRDSVNKMGIPFDMDEDFYPHAQRDTKHKMEQLAQDYLREENRGESFSIIEPRTAGGIAQFSEKHKHDLVIIGERGAGETHWLRGSTTDRLIRQAKVPVFAVDDSFQLEGIKKILVPTDGSHYSLQALRMALPLAVTFEASIDLFHVVELYGVSWEGVPRQPDHDEETHARVAIMSHITSLMDKDSGFEGVTFNKKSESEPLSFEFSMNSNDVSVRCELNVARGVSAHYEIEREAVDKADMVLMATHGHSGLAHLILGSTAEKVAQYVKKPVLTVRPEGLE